MQRHKSLRRVTHHDTITPPGIVEYHPSMSLEGVSLSNVLELLATSNLPIHSNDKRRQSAFTLDTNHTRAQSVTLTHVLQTRHDVWTSVHALWERLQPYQQNYSSELTTIHKLHELHILCNILLSHAVP